MATYMIFIREGEVTNHAAMTAYMAGNRSGKILPGMRPLAVYGQLEALEGESADGVVILEFPDRDTAKAWYFSEDYQARAKLRQQAAPYRCLMVEGL